MFTGIITHQGLFSGYRRGRQELLIEAPGFADKLRPGDSVSVDGVCLSLLGAEKGGLRFNLFVWAQSVKLLAAPQLPQ
jgi:riboflavin synthase alpha subunit